MKTNSSSFVWRLLISILVTPIILVLFPFLIIVGVTIYLFNLPTPKTRNEKLILSNVKACISKVDHLTTIMDNVSTHSITLAGIRDDLNFLKTALTTITKLI